MLGCSQLRSTLRRVGADHHFSDGRVDSLLDAVDSIELLNRLVNLLGNFAGTSHAEHAVLLGLSVRVLAELNRLDSDRLERCHARGNAELARDLVEAILGGLFARSGGLEERAGCVARNVDLASSGRDRVGVGVEELGVNGRDRRELIVGRVAAAEPLSGRAARVVAGEAAGGGLHGSNGGCSGRGLGCGRNTTLVGLDGGSVKSRARCVHSLFKDGSLEWLADILLVLGGEKLAPDGNLSGGRECWGSGHDCRAHCVVCLFKDGRKDEVIVFDYRQRWNALVE